MFSLVTVHGIVEQCPSRIIINRSRWSLNYSPTGCCRGSHTKEFLFQSLIDIPKYSTTIQQNVAGLLFNVLSKVVFATTCDNKALLLFVSGIFDSKRWAASKFDSSIQLHYCPDEYLSPFLYFQSTTTFSILFIPPSYCSGAYFYASTVGILNYTKNQVKNSLYYELHFVKLFSVFCYFLCIHKSFSSISNNKQKAFRRNWSRLPHTSVGIAVGWVGCVEHVLARFWLLIKLWDSTLKQYLNSMKLPIVEKGVTL